MQVRQILTLKGSALYTITPEQTVAEAIAIMAEHDVGSLVCFEAGRMVGMLTFRELLRTVHHCGAKAGDASVAQSLHHQPKPRRLRPTVCC